MIELDRLSGLRNLRTTEDEEMAVTKREAAIISAYTGILLGDFSEFNVKEWIGDGIEHIENPLIEWI